MEKHSMCMDWKTLILLRWQYSPKFIYRFNTISIQSFRCFLCRNWKSDPKIHMEMQGTQNRQKQSWKRTELEDSLPDIETYCTVIKKMWHWHKNRHTSIDQWDRMEDPKISPHIIVHWFFFYYQRHRTI